MIKLLFTLLAAVTLLLSSTNDEILARANALVKSNQESDTFRAYNDYKNLYLRSIVDANEVLKKSSLEGIIKSGSKLKIDVSDYEKELAKYSSSVQNTPKTQLKILKQNHLIKTEWIKDSLHISFKGIIQKGSVKYSTILEQNKNRYIYDIDSATLTSALNISKEGIDSIRVSQFTPQKIRVVIQNRKKLDITYTILDNELILNFGSKDLVQKPKAKPIQNITKESKAISSETLKKISSKVVVIDAGHGGNDPGAIGFKKYREKDIVFAVAKEVSKILGARGHKVFMTRNKDEFIKLSQRTKFANKKNADIFVSIHANAIANAKTNGVETYFLSPSRSDRAKNVAAAENSADLSDMNMYGKNSYLNLLNHHNILASNKLAIDIQRGVLASLREKYNQVEDMGVKEGPFWVLVGASMPSVLIEIGFVTNDKEVKRLSTTAYQNQLAKGIANGIDRYFANN